MATTTERLRQKKQNDITAADVVDGELIFRRYDGSRLNAGEVGGESSSGGPHSETHENGGDDELALDGSQITTGFVDVIHIPAAIARAADVVGVYQELSQKGVAGGYAELDELGIVLSAQLPSYVDAVLEYANFAALPVTGLTQKIYITLDDNKTFRWSGSVYVEVSSSLAVGETAGTAYRGDRGKIAYDHSQTTTGNPHQVTKGDVGLGNVTNTSDANKPVSSAQQTALDLKANDDAVAKLTGDQTIAGVKTFSTGPVVPTQALTDSTTKAASTAFAQGLASRMAPIRVISTVDFPTANVGSTWTDLDPGGSASARPMDIVIPNVVAGQWIRIEGDGQWDSGAIALQIDLWTIVAGVKVNQFGNGSAGLTTWSPLSGIFSQLQGGYSYQLQSGDISGGSVRVRLMYKKNSATARVLYGTTVGFQVRLEGSGPF